MTIKRQVLKFSLQARSLAGGNSAEYWINRRQQAGC